MVDDGKVMFLIVATHEAPSRWSRPFFVRAPSMAEAYAEVVASHRPLFQTPHIRLECFVVSISDLPDLKEVARMYWNAGREAEANPNHDSTFEEYWEEHGAWSEPH